MTDSESSRIVPPKGRAPRSPHVTIHVTREIIDVAIRRDSKNCMIAETINATFPNAHNVVVDAATIRWSDHDKGLRYTFTTPLIARDAILKFDLGKDIEPFSFTLRRAWVTGIRGSKGTQRISIENWKKIKEDVKRIRSERALQWNEIADEIGIPSSTLDSKA